MIKKDVISKNYCIEISIERMKEILKDDSIFDELDKINGITKIEYDGHFGPYIFLTLDVNLDTAKTWALLEELIA